MAEHTPSEADIRDTYGVGWNAGSPRPDAPAPHDIFSRWLAAHDAEVRADERSKRPDREQINIYWANVHLLNYGDRVRFTAEENHRDDWHGPRTFEATVSRVMSERSSRFGARIFTQEEISDGEGGSENDFYMDDNWTVTRLSSLALEPEAREEPKAPKVENLEIINGWLVERGVHPGEYPAGAAYGMLPDSDAEPLMDLSQIPGWPEAREVTNARKITKPEFDIALGHFRTVFNDRSLYQRGSRPAFLAALKSLGITVTDG